MMKPLFEAPRSSPRIFLSFFVTQLSSSSKAGVSVKFLMVGETNSMVGYHLMAEDHSIQLGVWGRYDTPAGAGQHPGGS